VDLGQVAFLVLALVLLAFTLGATVAWRLEARPPLVTPLWLVLIRNVSSLVLVAYLVVTSEPPSGVITVDPLWWSVLEGFMVVASLVAFLLELRHALRSREAS